jgi:hypothetical protein
MPRVEREAAAVRAIIELYGGFPDTVDYAACFAAHQHVRASRVDPRARQALWRRVAVLGQGAKSDSGTRQRHKPLRCRLQRTRSLSSVSSCEGQRPAGRAFRFIWLGWSGWRGRLAAGQIGAGEREAKQEQRPLAERGCGGPRVRWVGAGVVHPPRLKIARCAARPDAPPSGVNKRGQARLERHIWTVEDVKDA